MLALLAVVKSERPLTMKWEDWLAEYGDQPNPVSGTKDSTFRKETFEANMVKIQEHNDKGLSWKMGVNKFADLTSEEFSDLMGLRNCGKVMAPGLKKFEARQKGWLPSARKATNAESVDWRTTANPKGRKAVVGVKNQGQCGSCWSFSVTGAAEGAWALSGRPLTSLSEQMLVSCDKNDWGCHGGFMDQGLRFIKANGITSESNYPYVSGRGYAPGCDRRKESPRVIPAGAIDQVIDVRRDDPNAFENALNLGPVSIAIAADSSGFQFYHHGIFNGPCGDRTDHGVLAVGYGSENGQRYWIVKNSWGPGWGDQGYIKFARDINDVHGMCGMYTSAAYPVIPGTGPTPNPPIPTPTPPTPTPPTPVPPTPTPPTPTVGDWSDPGVNGKCGSEEYGHLFTWRDMYGSKGRMCLPQCNGFDCPAAPAGVTAMPTCYVAFQDTNKIYCELKCSSDSECLPGQKCVGVPPNSPTAPWHLCLYV